MSGSKWHWMIRELRMKYSNKRKEHDVKWRGRAPKKRKEYHCSCQKRRNPPSNWHSKSKGFTPNMNCRIKDPSDPSSSSSSSPSLSIPAPLFPGINIILITLKQNPFGRLLCTTLQTSRVSMRRHKSQHRRHPRPSTWLTQQIKSSALLWLAGYCTAQGYKKNRELAHSIISFIRGR